MVNRAPFFNFPKDAHDWFSNTEIQFPSYAFLVNTSVFPGTYYSDLAEKEMVESLKKIKRGQSLSERERKFW